MHRPGPAECDQRYQFGIAPFFSDMGFGSTGHGFIDKIMNAPDRLHGRNVQRFGNGCFNPFHGGILIKLHLTAQKIIRIQVPQGQIRIGDAG